MTLCPIALTVGCQKCPVFKICPVKTLIGDAPKAKEEKPATIKKTVPTRKPVPAGKKDKK